MELISNPSKLKIVGRRALSLIRQSFDEANTFPLIVDEFVNQMKKDNDAPIIYLTKEDIASLGAALFDSAHVWGSDGSNRAFASISKDVTKKRQE